MKIPRLRILAGTAAWSVKRRASGWKTRIPRVRITAYGLETAALAVAYLSMAAGLLALLGLILTRGQA